MIYIIFQEVKGNYGRVVYIQKFEKLTGFLHNIKASGLNLKINCTVQKLHPYSPVFVI